MNRLVFFISIFFFSFSLLFCAVRRQSIASSASGILRLHVIANSNSEKDQRVKLMVRDCVLLVEHDRLEGANSAESAAQYVMEDAPELLSRVDALLRENGCDYGAGLSVGVYPFPNRSYAGFLYPAGDYNALRIVLGEGAGRNWWCVLFPPLCILEDKDGKIEYTEAGEIKWKSLLREWIEKGETNNGKNAREEFPVDAVHSISSDAVPYADGGGSLAETGQSRRGRKEAANKAETLGLL